MAFPRKLTRRAAVLSVPLAALAACSRRQRIQRYNGPLATGIVVRKSERKMFILNGNTPLSEHDIELGFAPVGHKTREGDGKTPEGQYFIDRRNNRSAFFLSLGISYPNAQDRARANALGVSPGGDIFIHGVSRDKSKRGRPDWTAGCIAVTDLEMGQIFQMVPIGTPIWILA